jgi:hypothetical protein
MGKAGSMHYTIGYYDRDTKFRKIEFLRSPKKTAPDRLIKALSDPISKRGDFIYDLIRKYRFYGEHCNSIINACHLEIEREFSPERERLHFARR